MPSNPTSTRWKPARLFPFALLASSTGPAIALVGHDATNRALRMDLIPELKDAPQANGCWNKLTWDGARWQLAVLNATPGDGQHP